MAAALTSADGTERSLFEGWPDTLGVVYDRVDEAIANPWLRVAVYWVIARVLLAVFAFVYDWAAVELWSRQNSRYLRRRPGSVRRLAGLADWQFLTTVLLDLRPLGRIYGTSAEKGRYEVATGPSFRLQRSWNVLQAMFTPRLTTVLIVAAILAHTAPVITGPAGDVGGVVEWMSDADALAFGLVASLVTLAGVALGLNVRSRLQADDEALADAHPLLRRLDVALLDGLRVLHVNIDELNHETTVAVPGRVVTGINDRYGTSFVWKSDVGPGPGSAREEDPSEPSWLPPTRCSLGGLRSQSRCMDRVVSIFEEAETKCVTNHLMQLGGRRLRRALSHLRLEPDRVGREDDGLVATGAGSGPDMLLLPRLRLLDGETARKRVEDAIDKSTSMRLPADGPPRTADVEAAVRKVQATCDELLLDGALAGRWLYEAITVIRSRSRVTRSHRLLGAINKA